MTRVSDLLHAKGQRFADLSRATGIRQNKFTYWKRGEGEPSVTQAARIARALGVSLDWLASADGAPAAPDLSAAERLMVDVLRDRGIAPRDVIRDVMEARDRRASAAPGAGGAAPEAGGDGG